MLSGDNLGLSSSSLPISRTFMYLEVASNSLKALQSSKPIPVLFKCSFLMILNLVRDVMRFKNPQQGAQTSIYCAVSEEMEGVSGKYLADCKIQRLTVAAATDDEAAERLWRISGKMVGLECT